MCASRPPSGCGIPTKRRRERFCRRSTFRCRNAAAASTCAPTIRAAGTGRAASTSPCPCRAMRASRCAACRAPSRCRTSTASFAPKASAAISSPRRPGSFEWRRRSLEISRSPTPRPTSCRASSVSGDVIVNKLKASGFDAQTVSADLRLTDVEVDRASLRSVSGDVEYSGRLRRNGRYQFQSHSGDVRVTPADDTGIRDRGVHLQR